MLNNTEHPFNAENQVKDTNNSINFQTIKELNDNTDKEFYEESEQTETNRISSNLSIVLASREKLKKRKTQEIHFAQPIVWHGENAIIFPNTINVIQGQTGSHKSRLGESIASSIIKSPICENTLLNFNSDSNNGITVCLVDTERNQLDQLPYAIQQIQIKAGFQREENPVNFDYISLLEIERKQRFDTLKQYVNHVRNEINNHIFIILDVATDCVEDFNKVSDSMQLIDLMNRAINQLNVTFLCIIHENPNSMAKARGHLGTEITNKASTVLQVAFEKDSSNNDTELIRVKYIKCRSTKRYEPFWVKYSDTEKGLVVASDSEISHLINIRKHKAGEDDIIEFLESYLGSEEMKNAELLDKLCKDFQASNKTISGRLKTIIENESEIYNSKGERCLLKKKTVSKEVIFFLQPISNKEYSNYYEVSE